MRGNSVTKARQGGSPFPHDRKVKTIIRRFFIAWPRKAKRPHTRATSKACHDAETGDLSPRRGKSCPIPLPCHVPKSWDKPLRRSRRERCAHEIPPIPPRQPADRISPCVMTRSGGLKPPCSPKRLYSRAAHCRRRLRFMAARREPLRLPLASPRAFQALPDDSHFHRNLPISPRTCPFPSHIQNFLRASRRPISHCGIGILWVEKLSISMIYHHPPPR